MLAWPTQLVRLHGLVCAGQHENQGLRMIDGLGFCVIYRARVHPDKEQIYIAAWSRLTRLLRSERGALGSRLHRGADGLWYAYAQWASAEARAAAFLLPSVDPAAEKDYADSIVEYFPEIILDPIEDQLVPACELASRQGGDEVTVLTPSFDARRML